MSAHLTSRQIEDFKRRIASPPELLAVMNHIASCEACRLELSSELRTRAAVESLHTDLSGQVNANHLTYEELSGCVDESLSETDRIILESHVETCSSCAGELADLRAFKAEMTTYPEIERRPVTSASLGEKIAAFLGAYSQGRWLQLGTAAVVVLLSISTATLLLRKEPVREISELRQKDETPQEQNPKTEPQQTRSPNPAPAIEIAETIQDGDAIVSMDKQGNIGGLESLPPDYQREVRTALKTRRVETPSQLQELIGKRGVLMGSVAEGPVFSLIGPVGTIVRTDRPSFSWRPLNGATGYTVAVYDSSFNKVASSDAQTGTRWSPANSFKRGETYSWQVTAIKDGKEQVSPAPPAPDAKFKILDASKVKELEQAKRMYSRSHLLLGILYERAGLLDDAEHEFKIVSATNPNSQTARKLLNDLKSLRRTK